MSPASLDLLRRHDLRASFFAPGAIANLHPEEQRRVVSEDHEVHGWIHEGTQRAGRARRARPHAAGRDTLAKVAGRPPVGIWGAVLALQRHHPAADPRAGLLYDSSLTADDEPYERLDDGEPTGIVKLPVCSRS